MKQAQARRLQRLIAASEVGHRRGELLFRLAQIQLELAILQARERPDLDPAVFSCRRLLAEQPAFARADEVRLLLARLERRRGRIAQALQVLSELQRLHPHSTQRCQAWLMSGGCSLELKDRKAARVAFAAVLARRHGCAAALRHQARYQTAWTLLGEQQAGPAAKQLRVLCAERGVERRLLERGLGDLVLAWSMGPVDGDAASFLLNRAPDRSTGQRLVRELGRRLLEGGRLAALLTLGGSLPRELGSSPLSAELRVLRIRALARQGTAAQLERELAAAARGLSPTQRREVAAALLERARRLENDDAPAAEQVYRRLLASYGESPAAALARVHLGELLLRRGALEAAATALDAVAGSGVPEPLRCRAAYKLVYCREQLLERAPASERSSRREQLILAARDFLRRHPQAEHAADVSLALASRLAAIDGREAEAIPLLQGLLRRRLPHRRRAAARDLLLVSLARAGRQAEAYALARNELRNAGSNEAAARLRRAAARAARQRSLDLTARGRWSEARRWALQAAQADPGMDRADRQRLLLAAANLAARAGRTAEAQRLLRELLKQSPPVSAERRRLLEELARHQEAAGRLRDAAETYAALSEVSGTLTGQLRWLGASVEAAALDGDAARARHGIARLRRLLRGKDTPTRLIGPWQLRIGELLELFAGKRAAYRHYWRQANAMWRHDGPSAAICLVRAARLAPTPARGRRLYEQAQVQAGSLRRGGQVNVTAVRARLGLARLIRTARADGAVERRLESLQQQQAALLPLLRLPDPRWAGAAGLELARILGKMAAVLRAIPRPDAAAGQVLQQRAEQLRGLRRELLGRLASRAATPSGLDRFTLQAARELSGGAAPAPPGNGFLPSGNDGPVAAVAERMRRGQRRAAVRIADRALEVHGRRADILCVRGLARVTGQEVSSGVRDLRQALTLDPASRCARLNLSMLALWRGDADRARELLQSLPADDRERRQLLTRGGLALDAAARTPHDVRQGTTR